MQLGVLRGQIVLASFTDLTEHLGESVTAAGRLEDDTSAARQYQTEFHLTDIHILREGEAHEVDGRVVVRGFSDTTLQRGDIVRVEGRLGHTLGNQQGAISYRNALRSNYGTPCHYDDFRRTVVSGFTGQYGNPAFIPFAMLLTFVAATAGVVVPQFVGWFAWPADWILTTMLRVIEWIASLPWASMELSFTFWRLLGIYTAVAV